MYRSKIKALNHWKTADRRKPLIFKGARQVGKTYLIKEFAKDSFESLFYLNFEDQPELSKLFDSTLDPDTLLEGISFTFGRTFTVGKDLLVLDEIQLGNRALTSLKYFNEKLPQAHVIAAGSLLGLGLNTSSFPVGQVSYLDLYPMSFIEFLTALDEQQLMDHLKDPQAISNSFIHGIIWKRFIDYVVTGGMPEAVLTFLEYKQDRFKAYSEVRKIQQQLLNQYMSDIAKHSGKINAMHIERVLKSVPVNLARETQVGLKRYRFKDVIPGNNRYEKFTGPIDWLMKSGLVHKVPIATKAQHPLAAYTKENIFKLYLLDIGLLCALAGIPVESIYAYDFGSFKGYLAENFVLQEMITHGVNNIFSWAQDNFEIDFILTDKNEFIPIEVKAGSVNNKIKSLEHFLATYQSSKAYLFSAQAQPEHCETIARLPLYRSFQISVQL